MAENHLVRQVTSANFELEVLQPSRDMPVLADFWAGWCQPCLMLAPVLEQLAGEYPGKIRVTKINSDEEPELAARFGIRSLPTVKLFRDGQAVDEFSGALPLAAVRTFIEPHLSRESDKLLQAAEKAVADGNPEKALAALTQAQASDPENFRLYPLLLELLLRTGNFDEAGNIIKSLPVNILQDNEIIRLNARLGFARAAEQAPANLMATVDSEPENLDARLRLSAVNVVNGDYETAMVNLLEIIRQDRHYKDDAARKALVDIFTILGNQDPSAVISLNSTIDS